jgi:hypothetical protein
MVMSHAVPDTENGYADEGQQQLTDPVRRDAFTLDYSVMYNKNSCENTVNIFCSGTLVALK